MNNLNIGLSLIGAGAVRRIAISAGALLALAAVLLSGSGYSHIAAQGAPGGIDPGFQGPAAPGGIDPGLQGPTAPGGVAPGAEGPAMPEPGAPPQGQEPPMITPPPPESPSPETEQPADREQIAPAQPETATVGYRGLGLLPGVNYAPDRLIVVYKDEPMRVVNELSTATVDPLLDDIEAREEFAFAVSEDIAELDRGFDITNLEVDGGVAERNTLFVRADGEFDPLEVSLALNEHENVEFAQPDYYVLPGSAGTSSAEWFSTEWHLADINYQEAQEFIDSQPYAEANAPKVAVVDLAFDLDDSELNEVVGPRGHIEQPARWVNSLKVPLSITSSFLRFSRCYRPQRVFGGNLVVQHKGWDVHGDDCYLSTGLLSPISGANRNHGDEVAFVLASREHGVYRGGDNNILALKIGFEGIPYGGVNQVVRAHSSALIQAIDIARENRVKIINGSFFVLNSQFTVYGQKTLSASLAGHEFSGDVNPNFGECANYLTLGGQSLHSAIADFGAPTNGQPGGLFVTGAMNQARRLGFNYYSGDAVVYPQLFAKRTDGSTKTRSYSGECFRTTLPPLDNIINVGGTERMSTRVPAEGTKLWDASVEVDAPGSNHSPLYVHIAAPARGVRVNEGGNTKPGTSYASPQVAGTAAMMLQVNPELEPSDLIKIINYTGRTQGNLANYIWNGKSLDAHAAVVCAHALRWMWLPDDWAALETVLGNHCSQTSTLTPAPASEFGFLGSSGGGYEGPSSWRYVWIDVTNGTVPSGGTTLKLSRGGNAIRNTHYWGTLAYLPMNANGSIGNWNYASGADLTVPEGATTVKLGIYVYGNYRREVDRQLILTLSTDDPSASISNSTYTYTIWDDD